MLYNDIATYVGEECIQKIEPDLCSLKQTAVQYVCAQDMIYYVNKLLASSYS